MSTEGREATEKQNCNKYSLYGLIYLRILTHHYAFVTALIRHVCKIHAPDMCGKNISRTLQQKYARHFHSVISH